MNALKATKMLLLQEFRLLSPVRNTCHGWQDVKYSPSSPCGEVVWGNLDSDLDQSQGDVRFVLVL